MDDLFSNCTITKRWYSASTIKTYQNCPLQFYYDKIKKPHPKTPTLLEFALGGFLHSKIEKFYNKKGMPKYKSAKTFVNFVTKNKVSGWIALIDRGTYRGQEIDFGDKEKKRDGYGKIKDVAEICQQIYETYSKEKPPLEKEYKIRFSVRKDNMIYRFVAILDEIRYGVINEETGEEGIIIRDHKSDRWKPKTDSFSLHHDPQFTIYTAALSYKFSQYKEFARKIGVKESDIEQLAQNPLYMMDKICVQRHHMRDGAKIPTTRTKEDFDDVLRSIDGIERFIKTVNPRELILTLFGQKQRCDRCMYRNIHHEDYKKEKTLGAGYQPDLLGIIENPPEKEEIEQIEFKRKRKKVNGQWERSFVLPS